MPRPSPHLLPPLTLFRLPYFAPLSVRLPFFCSSSSSLSLYNRFLKGLSGLISPGTSDIYHATTSSPPPLSSLSPSACVLCLLGRRCHRLPPSTCSLPITRDEASTKGVFGRPSGPSRESPGVGHKIVSDTKQMTKERKKRKKEWEKGKMCKEKKWKKERKKNGQK